jgi:hypothetical protein
MVGGGNINQIFGKMNETLHGVIQRRRLQGGNEALERFMKFQPSTFVRKAETWLENLEDMIRIAREVYTMLNKFMLKGHLNNSGMIKESKLELILLNLL